MEFNNLKGLSNQAMVGATTGWIDPKKVRPILEGIAEVAGFLDKLTDAHNGLIQCQVSMTESLNEAQLKAMSLEAQQLDKQHDSYVHGIYSILEGCVFLADDASEVKAFTDIRNILFPSGLSAVRRSYLEEAGNVEMVKGRLDTAGRELLRSVVTGGGNLEEKVDMWLAFGTELGNLERKRSQKNSEGEEADRVTRADVVKARSQWIRVVRAVLSGLELADDLDENTLNRILQPLKDAVDKVEQRSSNSASAQAG